MSKKMTADLATNDEEMMGLFGRLVVSVLLMTAAGAVIIGLEYWADQ